MCYVTQNPNYNEYQNLVWCLLIDIFEQIKIIVSAQVEMYLLQIVFCIYSFSKTLFTVDQALIMIIN